MHKSSTVYKWKESKTADNNFGGFWWDVMDFFTAGSGLCTMNYGLLTCILARSNSLKLKRLKDGFVS